MLGLRLACDVGISTVVFLGCLVIVRLLGATLTTTLAWNVLWLATNLGFVWPIWRRTPTRPRRSLLGREKAFGGFLFLASYVLFFWSATRVVPAQVDQDLEVLATGFGLLTRFEPLLLTDRHGVYFFAHPPLLHFYVAGSFLLQGSLDELETYDEASRRVRDVWERRPVSLPSGTISLPGQDTTYRIVDVEGIDYVLAPEHGGLPVRASAETVELARIYGRYQERPHLVEARTPNLFFAAATVALLGVWVGRISRRWWMGLLVAAAYASSPEVFVRSSYGGTSPSVALRAS